MPVPDPTAVDPVVVGLSAVERSLRARVAAHSLHAAGGTNTAPARAAFLATFEAKVDPDGVLDPAERARRAEHARRAHFQRLALASVKARRARTEGGSS